MHNATSIIFSLINFGILLAIAVRALQRKIIPAFREQMLQEELDWQLLQQRKATAEHQQKKISNEILHQKQMTEDLLAKVQIWQNVLAQHKKQLHDQEKELRLSTAERYEKQQKNLYEQTMVAQLAKLVLPDARKKLQERYQEGSLAESYLDQAIKLMRLEK